MKQHWNTDKIEAALKAALPTALFKREMPGGDYDTRTIFIKKDGGQINVFGMSEGHPNYLEQKDWDDYYVDLVFACYSSKSGMRSAKAKDYTLLAEVLVVMESLGFICETGGWKDFF